MKKLFMTEPSWPGFVLRLTLGVVMFPHGAQKVLGWFGGPGFSGALAMFTDKMHIPAVLAILVIIAESLGALGLIAGFLTRIAALGIFCDMVGAVLLVHRHNGFFMNWMGQQPGEGYEYHLLVIGICIAVMIMGGGRFSVDREISRTIK